MEDNARANHLQWCKDRAAAYLDAGDYKNAWASFASDMSKNQDTKQHPAIMLGMQLLLMGNIANVPKMRKFINDFN
jgi:hypothetical protein